MGKENGDRKAGSGSSADPGVRYPRGCPIDGHQGYGCTCNPVRPKAQG